MKFCQPTDLFRSWNFLDLAVNSKNPNVLWPPKCASSSSKISVDDGDDDGKTKFSDPLAFYDELTTIYGKQTPHGN